MGGWLRNILDGLKKGGVQANDLVDSNEAEIEAHLEKAIRYAIDEVMASLGNTLDKSMLLAVGELIPIFARQGRIVLQNGLSYLRKLEIENAISVALLSATEDEKDSILKKAADGAYTAAINQYDDMERARHGMTLIVSLLLSNAGGIL